MQDIIAVAAIEDIVSCVSDESVIAVTAVERVVT